MMDFVSCCTSASQGGCYAQKGPGSKLAGGVVGTLHWRSMVDGNDDGCNLTIKYNYDTMVIDIH